MNKRFWVNIVIGIMSYPVTMILEYTLVPIEVLWLWHGITLACVINGIANFFAKD